MPEPTIYIIDDDPAVLDSLVVLLGLQGFRTQPFPGADAFLDAWSAEWTGCVLVDLRMPGKSGLELQLAMAELGITLPVVMITAHGDVSAARAAFKSGAVDFLEKPLDNGQLNHAIRTALERDRVERDRTRKSADASRQLARLTDREKEVLERVVAGRHNREIAAELGISARTVEAHKGRLMSKLGVERIPDLVRLVAGTGKAP
ncbi:MAG TPA: response regulator [Burkholderiales bacterium]|nr:response regulator [Burkholderiales bacterium]